MSVMKPKKPDEIQAMREGGKMLATVLAVMKKTAAVGVTPRQLAIIAEKELNSLGGKPAFRGVRGYPGGPDFPDIICISVNNQVQHAIPSSEPLEEGDVVNFDFGVLHKNMITDAGLSVGIGKVSAEAHRLLDGTEKALHAALGVVQAGIKVGTISNTIQKVLEAHKLSIVKDLVGHGVGYDLHEPPNIPNYGKADKGPKLIAGMTIAIEPITTLGSDQIIVDPDGWTLWTPDGSWSAQFEHTVLVTDEGCEILTLP